MSNLQYTYPLGLGILKTYLYCGIAHNHSSAYNLFSPGYRLCVFNISSNSVDESSLILLFSYSTIFMPYKG